MLHATWIDLDSLFNLVVHMYIMWPVYFVSYSVACIFGLFCGQGLFYAQSHSNDSHAVTDPAPSNEELNDSHLPQSFVPSTSPSMKEHYCKDLTDKPHANSVLMLATSGKPIANWYNTP